MFVATKRRRLSGPHRRLPGPPSRREDLSDLQKYDNRPPTVRKRLLVVDDHFDARNILREFFVAYGYQVQSASNGQEALYILRSEPRFDALILDLLMPEMSGYDVLRALKSERRPEVSSVPVIVISAVPTTVFPAGVACFPKPAPLMDILIKVEELVSRPRP